MKRALLLLVSIFVIAGCVGIEKSVVTTNIVMPEKSDFAQHVKPVFEHRCVRCHQNGKISGGMNLQDREAMLASGRNFIVPGKPEESLIYLAITKPSTHPTVMPGDGWGMSERHKRLFEQWIKEGADWPKGEAGKLTERENIIDLDTYL